MKEPSTALRVLHLNDELRSRCPEATSEMAVAALEAHR